MLQQRAVEGLIAVDTAFTEGVQVPLVAVSGHRDVPGVTNIVLNHALAAKLALEHLTKLGHRKMAFIKGQEFSSDTAGRWDSVCGAAQELGIKIKDRLVVPLLGEAASPHLASQVAQRLFRS